MNARRNIVTALLILLQLTSSFAQKGSEVADSLNKLINETKDENLLVKYKNELAYEYVSVDPAKSKTIATAVLSLASRLDNKEGIMNAHNNLGLAAYYSNEYETALEHYKQARDLAIQLKNNSKLAVALNNIGLVYDDKADYNNALSYYLQSLKLVEGTGESKYQLASTLNNIALIYQSQGKYDQALEFHERALNIKRSIGNKKGEGSSLHNIGLVYKLKGEYDKSLNYYDQALKLREAIHDESGYALTLNNIGSVYESKNELQKAKEYFEKSLAIRERLKDKYSLSITLFSLGSNCASRKEYAKAEEYLGRAMNIAKEIGGKDLIKYGYETYASMYFERGEYKKAFEHQKQFIDIKDSILNETNSKQLNELQTKYETEKKQKELELVTKESQIQALELNKNKMWMFVLIIAILLVLTLAGLFYNRYNLKQKANELLEHRNNEITQQKKEITDSINYAKRIQESILPPQDHWKKILPNSFIFYRPKDIVSGDFYWIEQRKNTVCFAAVDCTGHGVPGALMSVVGFNLLTQAVNEVGLTKPSDILQHLDAGVTKTLRQSENSKGVKDGMDLSLCSIDLNTNELQYAGAFNSLYYVSDNQLHEIKADKFPIGVNLDGVVDNYTNHTVQLKKGDCVYLFSDGYADQFGGPRGKKFKYNQLKEMFLTLSSKDLDDQKKEIEKVFDSWKGELEQVDDVVIIGVRI
ncbi:MAG: tetratricopeptide repeat protein [Bacteroidetes bacterium]|nr:tetratricopeptide repeat protein [Bacteroidota bacterium]